MTGFTHRDERTALGGCLGCSGLLVGLAAAGLAWWRAQPVTWSARVAAALGAVLFFAVVAVQWRAQARVARYQARRNGRARKIRDLVVAGANPPRPYFVYLRPFAIDGAFVEAPRRAASQAYVEEYGLPTTHHDLESALALLVYPFGDLVALSDAPGEAGAGHVRSTDATWRDEVRSLCQHAEAIFAVPFDFGGTAWEVEMLVARGWLDRTLFVMPASPVTRRWLGLPWFSRDYERLWEAGRTRYPALQLPEYDQRGGLVQVGADPRVFRGFGSALTFTRRSADRTTRDLEALQARLAELAGRERPR